MSYVVCRLVRQHIPNGAVLAAEGSNDAPQMVGRGFDTVSHIIDRVSHIIVVFSVLYSGIYIYVYIYIYIYIYMQWYIQVVWTYYSV